MKTSLTSFTVLFICHVKKHLSPFSCKNPIGAHINFSLCERFKPVSFFPNRYALEQIVHAMTHRCAVRHFCGCFLALGHLVRALKKRNDIEAKLELVTWILFLNAHLFGLL